MARVEIYSRSECAMCNDAKRFFDERGIAYEEYDLDLPEYAEQKGQLLQQGITTVPQVMIDHKLIGGIDALTELSDNGGLNKLLGEAPQPPDA